MKGHLKNESIWKAKKTINSTKKKKKKKGVEVNNMLEEIIGLKELISM
jgi:hypothetical protein